MSVRRGQRWGLTDGFGYDPEDDPGTYDPRQDRDHSASRAGGTGRGTGEGLRPFSTWVGPCTWCIPGEPCAFHQDGPS